MTRSNNTFQRTLERLLRKAPDALRNTPLFLLTAAVALAIEVFAAGGIFTENRSVVLIGSVSVTLAYAEAIMSASMTLVSLVLAGGAAAQKSDPRIEQQKRAGWTQTIAIAVLLAPVFYAGSCVALNTQRAEWSAYHGSDAEAADRATAHDASLDSMVRQDATLRLRRGIEPVRPDDWHLTCGMAWIGFLLFTNMLAVRLGWRARPESKTQRTRRQALGGNVHRLRA